MMTNDYSQIKKLLPEINRVVSKAMEFPLKFNLRIGKDYANNPTINLETEPLKKNLGIFKHIIEDYVVSCSLHDLRKTPQKLSGEYKHDYNGLIHLHYNHESGGSNGYDTRFILTIEDNKVGMLKRSW